MNNKEKVFLPIPTMKNLLIFIRLKQFYRSIHSKKNVLNVKTLRK